MAGAESDLFCKARENLLRASSFPARLVAVEPNVLNGVLTRVVGRSSVRDAEEAVRRIDIVNRKG